MKKRLDIVSKKYVEKRIMLVFSGWNEKELMAHLFGTKVKLIENVIARKIDFKENES